LAAKGKKTSYRKEKKKKKRGGGGGRGKETRIAARPNPPCFPPVFFFPNGPRMQNCAGKRKKKKKRGREAMAASWRTFYYHGGGCQRKKRKKEMEKGKGRAEDSIVSCLINNFYNLSETCRRKRGKMSREREKRKEEERKKAYAARLRSPLSGADIGREKRVKGKKREREREGRHPCIYHFCRLGERRKRGGKRASASGRSRLPRLDRGKGGGEESEGGKRKRKGKVRECPEGSALGRKGGKGEEKKEGEGNVFESLFAHVGED